MRDAQINKYDNNDGVDKKGNRQYSIDRVNEALLGNCETVY